MSRPKPSYVSDTQNPANDSPMSLTLRQMQRVFRGPIFWIIMSACVLLASLAGPYYTLERLSFPERMVYWGTTIFASGTLMTFISIFAYRLTEARDWNWVLVSTLAGVVGIIPVVCTIFLAEGIATGFAPGWFELGRLPSFALSTAPTLIAVTLVVNAVIVYQDRATAAAAEAAPQPQDILPPPTVLLSKLPHLLGRDIIAVRAQDHYVEVTTPQGSAMILMRLGDAVLDLEPLGGLQVHRSWWINLSHVVRTDKGPNGPEAVLSSDQRIPIGRSFRKTYRDATQS